MNTGSIMTSTTIPTEPGDIGELVFNSAPTPGGYIGWVYTALGWFEFGLIASTSTSVAISENAFTTADGEPFTLSDDSVLLYAWKGENNG